MMKSRSQQLRSLFLGGLLPVIAYAWVEDQFGVLWGLVAGMILGLGEILWEWKTQGRIEMMTWAGNGMLLILGGISLITQEGIWFKLQPSLIEMAMAIGLWVTVYLKKPFILAMLQKQGGLPTDLERGLRPGIAPILRRAMQGFTLRLGLFFAIHSVLAAWAALAWSTSAWAILKGIGLTVSMIVYIVVESLILRYRISSIP